jgi:methyltransferase (TIGR00027 family)
LQEQEPSRTAFAVAAHRAAHQVLDGGRIFFDPLAVRILGWSEGEIIERAGARSGDGRMRFWTAARARIAEEALEASARQRGARQLVILGAGLDTVAYRSPLASQLRIFEVDHPATQAWKRRRLDDAGIAVPDSLSYIPMDFERDLLPERLGAAGLDPTIRTFFMWLGVVPYLSREAIEATLAMIGGLAGGAEVVFDYRDPPETMTPERRRYEEQRAARVAAVGEPFLSDFGPDELHRLLHAHGFAEIRDLGQRDVVVAVTPPRILAECEARIAAVGDRGGHVVWAATPQ